MSKQQKMLGELVRITTSDGLELPGLLFEPQAKTNKAVVHIHGWVGNFYENTFIESIAKETLLKGHAFLSFNNRGAGIVQDFIKKNQFKKEYLRIGGSLEKFEDCLVDISATVNFLENRGYEQIVLEGHSLGCQKIAFYQYKTHDKRIKGLVLIAPVDDVSFTKKDLRDRYQEAVNLAREFVNKQSGDSLPEWMMFYPMLSAEMFLNVADPESLSGKIFDYLGEMQEIKEVYCPVLAIFGDKDEYQDDPADKLKILEERVNDCSIKLIVNSSHGFAGYEGALSKIIGQWLEQLK